MHHPAAKEGMRNKGAPGARGAGAPASFGHGDKPRAERNEPPVLALTLWPNRSLSPRGFRWFLWLLAAGLALPVLPLLGTPVGWVLVPFVSAMFLAVYFAFRRSYADGRLVERLRLWPDLITVERWEPRGGVRRWHADPFWVQVQLLEDGKVEKYLTLQGNGREIELGAFLSPEERQQLYGELLRALGAVRNGALA